MWLIGRVLGDSDSDSTVPATPQRAASDPLPSPSEPSVVYSTPSPVARRRGRPRALALDMGQPLHLYSGDITSGNAATMLLEHETKHKHSASSKKELFQVVAQLLPPTHALPTYRQTMSSTALNDNSINTVDVCVNDCIVFIDSHIRSNYRYAHAKKCPVCQSPRYNENDEPVKV